MVSSHGNRIQRIKSMASRDTEDPSRNAEWLTTWSLNPPSLHSLESMAPVPSISNDMVYAEEVSLRRQNEGIDETV
jgi:hypothetical protein